MRVRVQPRVPFAAIVLLLACALGACTPAEAPTAAAEPAPAAPDMSQLPDPPPEPTGPPRPALKVTTLDGAEFDLARHRGKWVVVNFWATWCKPCIKEMPELSALDALREHVAVVGLAYEEIDVEAMRAFLRKVPVVYPVAILDVANPPADFETPRGLPMTYLIAPDGRVARTFLGPVTAMQIEAAISANGGPSPVPL